MGIPDYPAHRISQMIKEKEISISQVVDEVLERIERREGELNAFISIFAEEARERAVELEEKLKEEVSPIYGIPVAVKDNILFRGKKTTCGSRILLPFEAPYNATAVERLLNKGAIIIGKTNLDEFGMGASGEYSYFGPTLNPINLDLVPGGSSSGSAAAVSSGESIAALGSDTGGSVRQPASFTGTVGLKPTYGRVSRYGLVAFASSLDQIGVITKDTIDAALYFLAIGGFDPYDSTSFNLPLPSFDEIFRDYETERFRIGIPKEYFTQGIEKDVEKVVLEGAKALEKEGFPIMEVSLPHTKYAVATYQIIATSEASSNLARYDGIRYGHRARKDESLGELYQLTRNEGFGEEVKRRILLGTFCLSTGYYEAFYLKALKARRLIKEDFEKAFSKVDVLLCPTSPVKPFKVGEKIEDPISLYLIDIYTVTANLAGLPAISIPGGKSKEGYPVGIQFIGKAFDESTLLKVARFYEEKIFRYLPLS